MEKSSNLLAIIAIGLAFFARQEIKVEFQDQEKDANISFNQDELLTKLKQYIDSKQKIKTEDIIEEDESEPDKPVNQHKEELVIDWNEYYRTLYTGKYSENIIKSIQNALDDRVIMQSEYDEICKIRDKYHEYERTVAISQIIVDNSKTTEEIEEDKIQSILDKIQSILDRK